MLLLEGEDKFINSTYEKKKKNFVDDRFDFKEIYLYYKQFMFTKKKQCERGGEIVVSERKSVCLDNVAITKRYKRTLPIWLNASNICLGPDRRCKKMPSSLVLSSRLHSCTTA